jgi:hypothetical protein
MLTHRSRALRKSLSREGTSSDSLAPGTDHGSFPGLERLIKDNPQFHLYEDALTSWAVHPDTLRFLFSLLTPGMSTVETGCGQTTVVFSIAGTKHTCIMPDSGEAERVEQYCAQLGLAKNITFIIESSDLALPCNEIIPPALDHVFIDGAHAFPAPIIDWHYTSRKLKVGGILGVDDYKMPSVRILYDFLCAEDEWELIGIIQNTAFFRKVRELRDIADWPAQKINSEYPGY